jgi:hypothetical protein
MYYECTNQPIQLNIPMMDVDGGVSTGNVADLGLSFTNQRLTSLDNTGFSSFFAAVTDTSSVSFGLTGTANVVAKTTIGNVPLSGIPFNVQSELAGVNTFGGTAQLNNVSITGSGGDGGNQYIMSPLTTKLQNPSNISLRTNDIALPVFFKGTQLGRAAINVSTLETLFCCNTRLTHKQPFLLVPGENTIPTVFEYMPADRNDTTAQAFITEFVTSGDTIDLTIQGDEFSSPFESLDPALEGVKISTSLSGLNFPNLITHINVFITADTLFECAKFFGGFLTIADTLFTATWCQSTSMFPIHWTPTLISSLSNPTRAYRERSSRGSIKHLTTLSCLPRGLPIAVLLATFSFHRGLLRH